MESQGFALSNYNFLAASHVDYVKQSYQNHDFKVYKVLKCLGDLNPPQESWKLITGGWFSFGQLAAR